MPWTPDNLSVKGALASFHQAMETGETIYDKHCQTYASTTDTEALTFPGFLPTPREFLDSRQFQGVRDFRYNVTNKEYELSMVVSRKNWEDDQTGLINQRMAEMGEVWNSYRDMSLFTNLLINGNVSGNNGFDGTTYHADTHVSGTVGQVNDNNIPGAATNTSVMTAAEFLTLTNTVRIWFLTMVDDTGRKDYNSRAIQNIRYIVPPGHARGGYEAMNQVAFTGGSGASNEFGRQFIGGVDVLPTLTGGTEIYASALGSTRKPFIYQERTPLEVIILTSAEEVAKNNGVMLLTRQRFVMTYGDFRRNLLVTVA